MKKLIYIVVFLILLAVAGVSVGHIYMPIHEDNVSAHAYEDLRRFVEAPVPELISGPDASRTDTASSPDAPSSPPAASTDSTPSQVQVDFESLRAVNPEVVGWLTIDGTDIDYPIAQHSDNDYYLHHLFNGEWNSSGCIFLDSRDSSDFSDKNSILYGHHMDNGSMFQNLIYYKDSSFCEEHPTAQLITPDGSCVVEFFAGYVSTVDGDAWRLDFTSDKEVGDWLKAVKEKSLFESMVVPTAADRIVTLSTCSYEFYNARFVVHGTIRE